MALLSTLMYWRYYCAVCLWPKWSIQQIGKVALCPRCEKETPHNEA